MILGKDNPGRAFTPAWGRPLLFLALALLTRWQTLGDRNWFDDDLLFFTIGQRMHDGALLYVDVWDRKPPGLFLIYYLITGISRNVIAYQLAGTLSVAATAEIIARIAGRIADRLGALLAGALYLCMLLLFGGRGGQAAVFFNLPMALAALLVLNSLPDLRRGICPPRVYGAMLLAGIALTCKQTAVFEGAFFGLFVLWHLARGGKTLGELGRIALPMALCGAVPMLGFAMAYAAIGHVDAFWHTMVTANTAKAYNPGNDLLKRAAVFLLLSAPALAMALAAWLATPHRPRPPEQRFAVLWLAAAVIGFAAVPNLIDHYALPVLVPLCVAMAPFLARRPLGLACCTIYAVTILSVTDSFVFDKARRDNARLDALLAQVRAHDPASRLFVFDGPVYLYALTGSYPPTPLIFPLHLDYQPEANVSPFPTMGEVAKVLAWQPTTVIIRRKAPGENLYNPQTTAAVLAYVRQCRWRGTAPLSDMYGDKLIDIYAHCANR